MSQVAPLPALTAAKRSASWASPFFGNGGVVDDGDCAAAALANRADVGVAGAFGLTAAADGAEAARPGGEPGWPLNGAGALGRAGRGPMVSTPSPRRT